jgi:hypothetical protein
MWLPGEALAAELMAEFAWHWVYTVGFPEMSEAAPDVSLLASIPPLSFQFPPPVSTEASIIPV